MGNESSSRTSSCNDNHISSFSKERQGSNPINRRRTRRNAVGTTTERSGSSSHVSTSSSGSKCTEDGSVSRTNESKASNMNKILNDTESNNNKNGFFAIRNSINEKYRKILLRIYGD